MNNNIILSVRPCLDVRIWRLLRHQILMSKDGPRTEWVINIEIYHLTPIITSPVMHAKPYYIVQLLFEIQFLVYLLCASIGRWRVRVGRRAQFRSSVWFRHRNNPVTVTCAVICKRCTHAYQVSGGRTSSNCVLMTTAWRVGIQSQ